MRGLLWELTRRYVETENAKREEESHLLKGGRERAKRKQEVEADRATADSR